MLIISAGMPRSASTWLYNILRIILENYTSGWFNDIQGKISGNGDYLIKIHDYNDWLAKRSSFIFYSYRDVRDAIASIKRKFNIKPDIKEVDHIIQQDQKWRKTNPHLVRYEDVITNPKKEVSKIIHTLGIQCDVDEVYHKFQQIPTTSSNSLSYDKITLFHPNHITKGGRGHWEEELDEQLKKKILELYEYWLVENNYIKSED